MKHTSTLGSNFAMWTSSLAETVSHISSLFTWHKHVKINVHFYDGTTASKSLRGICCSFNLVIGVVALWIFDIAISAFPGLQLPSNLCAPAVCPQCSVNLQTMWSNSDCTQILTTTIFMGIILGQVKLFVSNCLQTLLFLPLSESAGFGLILET